MSHTSGPWNVCERWPYQPDGLHIEWEQLQHMWIVGIRPGSGIAAIDNAPRENGEANARLIAAAPDLLEAIEEVYETLRQRWGYADAPYDPDMLHAIQVLSTAVARARGSV